MVQVEYIRFLREKGYTTAEIARKLDVSWRTARKYVEGESVRDCAPKQRRSRPVMGGHEHAVEAWLLEETRPKAPRRTAVSIYTQLVRQRGFEGSKRTVREYVRQARQKLQSETAERYVRLEHDAGEAQADFGEVRVICPDEDCTMVYSYLTVSLPYSNAHFCRVMLGENTECFLSGLQSVFQEMGGVPRVLVMDNLPAAVAKVLKETERQETKMFADFREHYGFEAAYCAPGRGNEKGHVEGKIGYQRRNFMAPQPVLQGDDGLDKLNRFLQEETRNDRQREHSSKGEQIETLWNQEREELLTLPKSEFAVVRTLRARVNKYCEASIGDKETCHFGAAHPGQTVFLRIYWDRVEAYDEYGEEMIQSAPRQYAQRAESIDWRAELALFQHKPRALECATYLKALPEAVRSYLLPTSLAERRRRVGAVLKLLEDGLSIRQIEAAAAIALESSRTDPDSLKAIAGYHVAQERAQTPVREPWTPQQVSDWQPDLRQYDSLSDDGGWSQ